MKIAGIGVYVHATFWLLLIWVGYVRFTARGRWEDAAAGVAFILVLFAIVVMHEFGHALTARRFGVRTRDITLLPIGGVARLERIPEDPKQELLIALAGPAVNVCLAAICFALIGANWQLGQFTNLDLIRGNFLGNLMWINVGLAVFNMMPAFPMDGGRVLRALLAIRLRYEHATRIAAWVGQGLAMLLAFGGLASMLFGGPLSNPFLILIAMFIWMGARQEYELVRMRSALANLTAGQAMLRNFSTIQAADSLGFAAQRMAGDWQPDFPVVDRSGRLVGMLTRVGLRDGLSRWGIGAPVEQCMIPSPEIVDPDLPIRELLSRPRLLAQRILPVARHEQLFGVLDVARLGEYLSGTFEAGQAWRGAAPPVISDSRHL